MPLAETVKGKTMNGSTETTACTMLEAGPSESSAWPSESLLERNKLGMQGEPGLAHAHRYITNRVRRVLSAIIEEPATFLTKTMVTCTSKVHILFYSTILEIKKKAERNTNSFYSI